MNTTAWALGTIAGVTIFFGLPIARLKKVTPKIRAFLNALSTGILVFLLVEIAGHLIEEVEEAVKAAAAGAGGWGEVWEHGGLFAAGFIAGLLGLVYFEQKILSKTRQIHTPQERAKATALMIAVGLGLHNFGEGLAIGQGVSSGAIELAWVLGIGFALHNATEGFGIAAPLSGQRVSWKFLALAGAIGGGPTLVGSVLGSSWTSEPVEIFCLALAAGTILYVIGELLHLGKQLKEEWVVPLGLLAGFFIAMASDFVIVASLAG